VGTADQGFDVVERSDEVDGVAPQTRVRLEVKAHGLAAGCVLQLLALDWDLTLTVAGPEDAAAAVADDFTCAFDRPLTPAQLESVGIGALVGIRTAAWERAKECARAVLRQRPADPTALLALGIASGATGDVVAAHSALVGVLESQPREYDAWYNLGLAHRRRREPLRAAACFRTVLAIDAGNHPASYELGRALEALGRTAEAVAAYEAAVRTSPNPGGAWGYRGMDLTRRAQEALARLGGTAAPRKRTPPRKKTTRRKEK
jgi:tetratricopeptide (TPR) repeat protein